MMNAKSKTTRSLAWRRILVPIDFSKNARRALGFAVPLAAQSGARILLLHVIVPSLYPPEMGIMVPEEKPTLAVARKHLLALSQRFIPEKLRDKVEVRVGQPAYEIPKLAKQWKVGLIVQTTHGYTGLSRILLGSTAEQIIRHASCPVLTVRAAGMQ